jgi:hypothetical protein
VLWDESDCESFEPSVTSCWQLFTDVNDDEEEDDDDDEEDELELDELEPYALDEPELLDEVVVVDADEVVVAGAEVFELPPQPAATRASARTEANARLRVI